MVSASHEPWVSIGIGFVAKKETGFSRCQCDNPIIFPQNLNNEAHQNDVIFVRVCDHFIHEKKKTKHTQQPK